jgi:hypothetical protein
MSSAMSGVRAARKCGVSVKLKNLQYSAHLDEHRTSGGMIIYVESLGELDYARVYAEAQENLISQQEA